MVTVDGEEGSIQRTFTNWLFGQEANTVALYLILIAIGYGGWWTITVGVPKHLDQIQHGYETLSDRHSKAIEDINARHSRELESVGATYEKSLDRMERAFSELKKQ